MFSSAFQIFLLICNKNITICHYHSNFSTPAIFSEDVEPMCVTADDIIHIGDDVNIYPIY